MSATPTPVQVLAMAAGELPPDCSASLEQQVVALREVASREIAAAVEALDLCHARTVAAYWLRLYCSPWPERSTDGHDDPVQRVVALYGEDSDWSTRAALQRVQQLAVTWDLLWTPDGVEPDVYAETAADLAWCLAALARGDQARCGEYLDRVLTAVRRGPTLCACE